MSTSGSVDFSISRDTIIKMAYQHIQYIGEGDTPTTTQITEVKILREQVAKNGG